MKQFTPRAARLKAGYSVSGLAREMGVSRATVQRLESGTTSPLHETAERMEKLCGVPIVFRRAGKVAA